MGRHRLWLRGVLIPFSLADWAARHGVSPAALDELRHGAMTGVYVPPPPDPKATSEAYAQSLVRLEAPHKGCHLFRNNVGALIDERGVPVRYGLANDSPATNRLLKSGDLIGWRRVLITPAHVGRTIAQFLSRECKRPGWKYSGNDREEAQERWNNLVLSEGGDAAFTTGPGSL